MTTDRIIVLILIGSMILVLWYYWGNNTISHFKEINSMNQLIPNISNNQQKIKLFIILQGLSLRQSMFMREYIIRVANQLSSQQEILNELMSGSDKMAYLFGQLTGNEATFKRLSNNHIKIFDKVVTALVTHDGENYDMSSYAWAKNGVMMAGELQKISPNYKFTELKQLILSELQNIELEIRAIINQKPAINKFNTVINSGLLDYLVNNYK